MTARTRRTALIAASVVLVVLVFAKKHDTLREGLTATYFPDTAWSAAPALSRIEPQPSADNFYSAWSGSPPDAFGVIWSGRVMILRSGTYTFATDSDDGSWLYVDGRLVVDNGGHHPRSRRTGSIRLDRGAHPILLKYAQDGDDSAMTLLWGRDASALSVVPAWVLFNRSRELSRLLVSVVVRRAVPIAFWLWLAAVAVSLAAALSGPTARWSAAIRADRDLQIIAGIVGCSLALNTAGIWWGLPGGWAGDETTPLTVLTAMAQGFSGGWFDRYPPFHMELLALVFSPWLILKSADLIHVDELTQFGVFLLVSRIVSLLAAAGTVIAVYRIGREYFNRRVAWLAAAALGVLTPFLYYAKTTNPEALYVFWFAVSLVFYLRLLRTLDWRDFIGFAVTAMLSICTKDQAYGLYLLTPVVIVHALWQSLRRSGRRHPWLLAITDRRLWIAGGVALALFALIHNLPVNTAGFVLHVEDIIGPGSEGYRFFEPTLSGRLALLRMTFDLNQRSWGWPLWIASLAGFGIALRDPGSRRVTILLALVIVSYYVGFIDVILYTWDRYLLPLCVIEALFAGVLLDRLLAIDVPAGRIAARTAVAAVFAYTLLYALPLDVLMIRDSRYVVERWMTAHSEPHRVFGRMFPIVVLPRLDHFRTSEIRTVEDLRAAAPDYFILNVDYSHAVPPDLPEAALVSGLRRGDLGYRLALRYRTPRPWPWLPIGHPDVVGPRQATQVLSVLYTINPTMEIYERRADAR